MASLLSRKGAVRVATVTLACLLPFVLGQSVCPPGSTPTWSPWACDTTTNVSTRLGMCNDNDMTVITDTMDGTVIGWSEWSPWLPACGSTERIQERQRTCTVPGNPYNCSSCGTQNVTQEMSRNVTSLVPCCEEFSWRPWSTWSPAPLCCNGDRVEQTRRRSRAPCEGDNCPECTDDVENRTALIQGWGAWGTWSDFLRSCSEATYRNRSRVCAQPINTDNLTVFQFCQPFDADVEYGCCQETYMWAPLNNTSTVCQQMYCVEVCTKMATPVTGSVSVRLTDEQLVCNLCVPGTQRNITGQVPTVSATPFPFLSTYWWVILLIIAVAGMAVVLIVAAFVLCYKSYRKYRHTYYLKFKRETMQGVYGNVMLGQRQQPGTEEQRKLSGTYWSNPLHDGKEDVEHDMAVEEWGSPFQVVKEDLGILTGSAEEEDNLILTNPAFRMKSALSHAGQEEGTAMQGEHPRSHRFKIGDDIETETRGLPATVSQVQSGVEYFGAHPPSLEVGNQSAGSAPSAHSSAAWERFDNSISDEEEAKNTADILQNDLSSETSSVDGREEEGSEDEEQREEGTVYHQEPMQGMHQQPTLLARARDKPPEGNQELERMEVNTRTLSFEGEFTWETFDDNET